MSGLREEIVSSAEQVFKLLELGEGTISDKLTLYLFKLPVFTSLEAFFILETWSGFSYSK